MSTEESTSAPTTPRGTTTNYENLTSAEILEDKLSRFNRTCESNHNLVKEAFTSEEIEEMKPILDKQGAPMTKYWSEKLEHNAVSHWHKFYQRNTTNFFKDRHYIHREIPELVSISDAYELTVAQEREADRDGSAVAKPVLLEVGCGVGNTVYPLLEDFPCLRILCCDCAPSAIDLVKKHALYNPDRVDAQVADISSQPMPYPLGVADVTTLIFVMSALSPQTMDFAFKSVRRTMKPGATLFMRDYAAYDLTMLRFKAGAKINDRFYKRGDGTRTYFFERVELMGMLRKAGFKIEDDDISYIKKTVENRKEGLSMKRTWIQCKCIADPDWVDEDTNEDTNGDQETQADTQTLTVEQ